MYLLINLIATLDLTRLAFRRSPVPVLAAVGFDAHIDPEATLS